MWFSGRFGGERGRRRVGCLLAVGLLGSLLAAGPVAGPAGAADISICGRDPAVVKAIEVALGGASFSCSAVDEDELDDIDFLGVRGYGRFAIDPADFAGLDALLALHIEDSPALQVLPRLAFSGVPSLTHLVLSGNGIRGIEDDAFASLPDLVVLDLGRNALRGVPEHVFDSYDDDGNILAGETDLSGLETLVLEDNLLSELTPDVFEGLNGLLHLSVRGNQISNLDNRQLFDHLDSLEVFDASDNRIESVAGYFFIPVQGTLREVYLGGNELSDLIAGEFFGYSGSANASLEKLEILSLERNGLETVAPWAFNYVPNLEQLMLQGNDLDEPDLSQALFDPLDELVKLDLSRNPLGATDGQLNRDLFDGMAQLYEFDLSLQLPSAFFELNLGGTGLSGLHPSAFFGYVGLASLDLSDNSLSSLPSGVFDHGPAGLSSLDLSGNSLSSLDAGVFDELVGLTSLDLSGNSLSSMPAGVFDRLASLDELNLSGNSLSSLPAGVFDSQALLLGLDLSDNSLTSLDTDLLDLADSLEFLDLSGNGLTSLDVDFFKGDTFVVDGNDVTVGPFGLVWLDLSDNALSSLPEDLFKPLADSDSTSLWGLFLRANQLPSLPQHIFRGLDTLERLDLACNSFTAPDTASAASLAERLDGPKDSLRFVDFSGTSYGSQTARNRVISAVKTKLTGELHVEASFNRDCEFSLFDDELHEVRSSAGRVEYDEHDDRWDIYVGTDVDEVTITPIAANSRQVVRGEEAPDLDEDYIDAQAQWDAVYAYHDADTRRAAIQVDLREGGWHDVWVGVAFPSSPSSHLVEEFDGHRVRVHREPPRLPKPCTPGAVSLNTPYSDGLSNGAYGHGIPGLHSFDGSRREFLVPAWAAADNHHCVVRTELWREDGRFEEDRIPGYPDATNDKAIYDIVGDLDTSVPELAKAWDGAPRQETNVGPVEGGWIDRKTRLYEVYRYTILRFGTDGSFSQATTRWIPVLPFYVDRDASWHEPWDANGNLIPANEVDYYVKIEMGGQNGQFGRGAALALSGDEVDLAVGSFAHKTCVASIGRPVCGNPASIGEFSAGDVSCMDFVTSGTGLTRTVSFSSFASSNASGHMCFKLSRSQGVCSQIVWDDPDTLTSHLFYDGCKMFDYAWARNAARAFEAGEAPTASTAAVPWPEGVSLAVKVGESPSVLLWWEPADPVGAEVAGYQVMRRADGEEEFSLLGSTSGAAVFSDTDVEKGAGYVYTVKTVTTDGSLSEPSSEVSVSVPDSPTQPPPWAPALEPVGLSGSSTDRGVTLRWVLPAQPDEVYVSDMYLERLVDDGDGGVEVAQSWDIESDPDTSAASSWTHTVGGLESGTQYRFSVRLATEDQGDAFSETLEVSTQSEPPVAPRDLSVAWADPDDGGGVDLSWEIPTQPAWLGAVNYVQVQRDVSSSSTRGKWQKVGEVSWDRATTRYSFNDSGADADAPQQRYRIAMYAAGHVHFSDVAVAPGPDSHEAGPLRGFSLVNATEQSLVAALGDGDTVELANPDTGSFAISADLVAGHNAGSVGLELTGPVSYGPVTDNSAPYSLHGDSGDGDMRLSGRPLPAGEYTLTATAWSQTRLRGWKMGTLEISFTVTEDPDAPEVSETGSLAGFRLVNAADQSLIATLADGDTVALDSPDTGSFAIEAAIVDGHSVGSVSFELTGPVSYGPRTESYAPYSLHGDTYSGDIELHGQPLPPGQYTLTATAYTQRRLQGDQAGTFQIAFTITTQ